MAKSQKQKRTDATNCAYQGCKRIGLYKGRKLTFGQFRKKPCADAVKAAGAACPLKPDDYTLELKTFREAVRASLKKKGYAHPVLMLQMLCASDNLHGKKVPWTWGDWCDHLAGRL